EGLSTDFLEGKTADHWREAIDKINLGKMPPEKEPRPDPKEAFVVVEWVNQELRAAEKRAQSTGGRVPMRRLNRTEYANTVRDLFHLEEKFARKFEQELPADGKVDGFDRGGAALFIDKAQLEAYLEVARMVIDNALPLTQPKVNTYRHVALKDIILNRKTRKTTTMKEILERAQQYSNIYSKTEPKLPEIERGPEFTDFNSARDGGMELLITDTYTGYHLSYLQRGDIPRKVVTQDGWYRVKLRAGADRGSGKFAVDAVRVFVDYCKESKENGTSFSIAIDAPLDQPKEYEQLVYLRHGGPNFEKGITFTWNIYKPRTEKDQPLLQNLELKSLLQNTLQTAFAFENANQKKLGPEAVNAAREKRDAMYEKLRNFAETFKGPVYHVNPDVDFKALPRLWYEYVELEGPLTLEWPTKAANDIFFKGEEAGDYAYAREIFTRFLPRAYRRPVKAGEIDALVKVVKTMQDKHGKTFREAVRSGVLTVLTSPDFLYLQEPTGADTKPHELNDYELASRLSYFLWSTMPDAELLALAEKKKLKSPEVLIAQVKRMALDPKARQFVENFVGQWMRVRDFGTVMVDARQYPAYDPPLRDASLREPYEFFHELLRTDASLINLLESDFLVVNERLAKHYGIEGVEGDAFRRVALKPEHRRGGILGMAGLLTYLSDGTRTQPVKRGAYVLDVLWNTPAPLPPPNAGDLPVIKGKNLSVRQRLEQHRSVATCASCHAKIDPLGLGLENYDAIGLWRERQNGEGRRGDRYDPVIDSSGVMPNGKVFQNLPEYKQALLDEKDKFLKGFTEKMLAYALGRPVGVTDRTTVEQVLAETSKKENRLQAMLQAIVMTRAFQTK
ncbi:MAG: DUF1592 domain-containing protein, partial [Planctomycetes bacterium]|nr:DUF1592 domain-containing protein [Planctomycetota bacterium]